VKTDRWKKSSTILIIIIMTVASIFVFIVLIYNGLFTNDSSMQQHQFVQTAALPNTPTQIVQCNNSLPVSNWRMIDNSNIGMTACLKADVALIGDENIFSIDQNSHVFFIGTYPGGFRVNVNGSIPLLINEGDCIMVWGEIVKQCLTPDCSQFFAGMDALGSSIQSCSQ
jgi:hypothetical protein